MYLRCARLCAAFAEYTPFLHKLLLLRDAIREQLGLPGGLHEPARPDAFEELDESVKALWVYKIGSPPAPGSMAATLATGGASAGVDFVQVPPLIVAAARGNVDAVHLLLLFGEGVYERRKTNDRALYVACEQGNIGVVAVLLGRVPLRPPKYPQHIAERLGLIRPVWPVYAPGRVYAPGVAVGPHNLPAVLAATKIRAHLASATGMATEQGPRASATAAASNPSEQARMGARVSATSVAHAGVGVNGGEAAHMSTVEAQVAQQQQYENDGRYRSWCRGYHMGTYWYLYDTALANYEYIHGRIGDTQKVSNAAAAAGASSGGVSMPRPAPLLTLKNAAARSLYAAARIRLTLQNVSAYLDARLAPGSIPIPMDARSASPKITQAFLVQGALMDRLPPTVAFVQASRVRKRGIIHPRIQDVVDYGSVAAEAIAVKVRINVGPVEGRTPLHVACER
ncbi:MAG: ankyrin repeat domain-containing protein [Methanobacteriota archaeon]|nr:MAG: ankyrin repeat domain-containing protein [Euryarchaeota archaeon]